VVKKLVAISALMEHLIRRQDCHVARASRNDTLWCVISKS